MDIIYVIGTGSVWGNNELRYSIRSVEKYLKHDNIWIIGNKPGFITNVFHVPFEDPTINRRNYNICQKILCACDQPVSDDFIFMNDDHFILKPIDEIKYWHNGGWDDPILKANVAYKTVLINTRPYSKYHFDIHVPIVYNKERFQQRMNLVDWGSEFAIKSLYCGNIEGEYMEDCKINARLTAKNFRNVISGRKFFSIGDWAICDDFKIEINRLYPDKSKYEI